MGIYFSFYNTIIKCWNVDKGGGGGSVNVDKVFGCFKGSFGLLTHIW